MSLFSIFSRPSKTSKPDHSAAGKSELTKTPATRKKRKVTRKTAGWLAALGVLVLFFFWRRGRSGGEEKPEVKTAKVERGDVRSVVSATGKLQPFSTVDVKSRAGGTVLKLAVEEGTRVRKGQLICLIDEQDVSAAYRQAQADLAQARASLRQAEQNARLQNTSIGPQIQSSSEAVAGARASLKQARETLTLESSNVGPAIAQSTQAVATARARLRQARETLELQRKTTAIAIVEARSGVAASQARLEQAVEQSRTQPALSSAAVNQAQAGVEAAEANVRSSEQNLQLLRSATQPQATAAVEAQVDQANSDLKTAQLNLKRQEALLARGFVAQNTVDTLRNQVVTAQSSLRTAQARLDTIKVEQAAQVRDQEARVEQARGSLNQSRAALVSARTNTVQNTLREKDVNAARAAVKQSQAALNTAVANQQQISLRQSDVTAAQAAVRQAEAALQTTRAGTRQVNVRAAGVENAQAAVRQAEAALKTTQANTILGAVRGEDVARARAQLQRAEVTAENARTNLGQTRVVSPRDGIVLKKYVDEGTIIQSGQSGFSGGTAIVQLANVARIYVDVQVDEADIALIQAGQKVDISLDAYPDSPKTGKVRKVFPEAEELQNVTYIHAQVEVDSKDVDANLRPNMNATCDFLVKDKKDVLVVPSEAVKDDEKKTLVTVIKDPALPLWDPANQVKQTVQVGVRGDEKTEILSGLKPGDTVVTQIIQPVTATPGGSGRGGAGGGGRSGGGGLGGIGGAVRPPRR